MLTRPISTPTHPRWVDAEPCTVPARSIIWPRTSATGRDAVFVGRASHGLPGCPDRAPLAFDVDAPASLLADARGIALDGQTVAYAYGWSFNVGAACNECNGTGVLTGGEPDCDFPYGTPDVPCDVCQGNA